MTIIIKDVEEKLGKEKVEELVEKDWKVAELPSEEELKKAPVKSSKARNNPNSRANLFQYRKDRSKEQKEKVIKNLKFTETEEDADPKIFLDSELDVSIIQRVMPAVDFLTNRREQELYYTTINLFLKDFDVEELTSSDLDDIITLAINKILEYRLLKESKQHPKLLLDVSSTIEKFRKHSDKVKEGLASRRVDRIDVKNKPTFSIVDLAARLDDRKRDEFERRISDMKKDEAKFLADKKNRDEGE